MLSFWEKDQFCKCDIAIIGGGIVGLSTAISLKEEQPHLEIALFERGVLPTGASTRNAGFACFAKANEMISDLKLQSQEEVIQLAMQRYLGLEKLKRRLGPERMDLKNFGAYELVLDAEELQWDKINEINTWFESDFNQPLFSLRDEKLAEFDFRGVKHLIYCPFEGQIHSGLTINNLMNLAKSKGVKIWTGAALETYEEVSSGYQLSISRKVDDLRINWICDKIVFCNNAWIGQFFPEYNIKPGRGQVLITQPIDQLKIKGSFHFDEGYYYFRNFEDRVLFGGGRNLDFEGESTFEIGLNEPIQEKLETYLREMILPNVDFEIDQRWSGIMGFSENKKPIIKKHKKGIYIGFSCNGMGIALGTESGEQLAQIILKD